MLGDAPVRFPSGPRRTCQFERFSAKTPASDQYTVDRSAPSCRGRSDAGRATAAGEVTAASDGADGDGAAGDGAAGDGPAGDGAAGDGAAGDEVPVTALTPKEPRIAFARPKAAFACPEITPTTGFT